jgi:hypothetical protein
MRLRKYEAFVFLRERAFLFNTDTFTLTHGKSSAQMLTSSLSSEALKIIHIQTIGTKNSFVVLIDKTVGYFHGFFSQLTQACIATIAGTVLTNKYK